MTKIKPKILIFILLLIMVATCFCGCSSARVMTITNEDGTIDELVYVTLDAQAVQNAGYNIDALKAEIMLEASIEIGNILKDYNNRIEQDKLFATDEAKQILESFKGGIQQVSSDWENDTCAVGIRFANIDVYRYYYGITGDTSITMQKEEHFLYDKVYYYAYSMYADYSEIYNRMNVVFSTKYPEFVENENNELLYTYVTSSRREHSDSDYVTKVDGKYYHTWKVDCTNVDEPVMIYYNIANRGNCILLCIGVSIIICVIMLCIGLLIERKKKKRKTIV